MKEYRQQLVEFYPWAQDADKLDKYMASVKSTLIGNNTWNCSGDALLKTCKALNIKSSLKALRALPDEVTT